MASREDGNRGIRIAMWSGPRNISTALMRSWGSRADTYVCDEPLYAHYLLETGVEHPGRDEVVASQETDWRKVIAWLTGDIPEGKSIFYQKHMAHHLLPGIDRSWILSVTNAFLIRDPREMLASLVRVMPSPTLADTGLQQQWDLFRMLRDAGLDPPVIDARDVLEDPRGILTALCARLGVAFDEAMLSWKPGPRATDGVWAPYWYAAVEQSTGFTRYQPKPDRMPGRLRALVDECQARYDELFVHRLGSHDGGRRS